MSTDTHPNPSDVATCEEALSDWIWNTKTLLDRVVLYGDRIKLSSAASIVDGAWHQMCKEVPEFIDSNQDIYPLIRPLQVIASIQERM